MTSSATKAKASPKSDTRYLQRIGSRWYARIPVPNKLRPEMGPYLRKSLDTADFREAQERRWDVGRKRSDAKARGLIAILPQPRSVVAAASE